MNTPIERAAQAIRDEWQEGMKATNLDVRDAQAVFESIDTEEMTKVLLRQGWVALNEGPLTENDLRLIATSIKDWLTGKETNET